MVRNTAKTQFTGKRDEHLAFHRAHSASAVWRGASLSWFWFTIAARKNDSLLKWGKIDFVWYVSKIDNDLKVGLIVFDLSLSDSCEHLSTVNLFIIPKLFLKSKSVCSCAENPKLASANEQLIAEVQRSQ